MIWSTAELQHGVNAARRLPWPPAQAVPRCNAAQGLTDKGKPWHAVVVACGRSLWGRRQAAVALQQRGTSATTVSSAIAFSAEQTFRIACCGTSRSARKTQRCQQERDHLL